jgi:hypothetical protein
MDGAERCPALDDVEEPPIVGPFRSPLESEGLELEMRRASRLSKPSGGADVWVPSPCSTVTSIASRA